MNREIKFRYWHKKEKRFVFLRAINFVDNTVTYDCQGECNYDDIATFNNITPQQYTGLKDKNGVDIYEGDTLIWYGKDHKAPVVFSPTSSAFVLDTSGRHLFDDKYGDHLDLHKDHEYEIVGNIFENSELLEK